MDFAAIDWMIVAAFFAVLVVPPLNRTSAPTDAMLAKVCF